MSAQSRPSGHHTLTPYLIVKGAAEAIEFYKRAFGAEEILRMTDPGGERILHAEIRIGDSALMMTEECPEFRKRSPLGLGGTASSILLYDDDVDARFRRAVEAGAKPETEPRDMFWGDRWCVVTDPFGHEWQIATHKEDLTREEMGRRARAFFAGRDEGNPLKEEKTMSPGQTITPCLWFDTQAEEAARFYVSVFKGSRIVKLSRYGEEGFEIHGRPAGSVMTVEFELGGQRFTALNGGPQFRFTEAISLQVGCATQDEVDYYWDRLSAGGEEGPCGWLKDRFGLSWQVVPTVLGEMMSDPDSEKVRRVTAAFLQMKRFDIAALRTASEG